MRKTLLTSGLIIGVCLLSALPAVAATRSNYPGTHNGQINIHTSSASNINASLSPQITTLRQTDKRLADQLKTLKQSNRAQLKVDKAQNNYTALLAANKDQIAQVNDYTTDLTDSLNLQKDELQLQEDSGQTTSTTTNTAAVAADLANITTDLNNQISSRTQLITDAQKILVDLGGSVTTSTDSTEADTPIVDTDQ